MRGLGRAGLIVLSLALTFGSAAGWAPQTRIHMVDEAVRLMPASLRVALGRHRESLLRGMLEPMTQEDSPEHRPEWAGGSLDAVVEREAASLVASLREPGSFDAIARGFGRLAHYVTDAGFPPLAGGTDDERRYADFAAFCEDRRERFPLVFYGHDDAALAVNDFRAFAMALLLRARDDDRELARAYAAAGDPPDPAAFDDRSLPFAIGSLSYSRGITSIVRAWLAAWSSGGGDMGRTPYLRQPTTQVETGRRQ
jgi:hypothetical protein